MYKNGKRVMAWVCIIDDVIPHNNADSLEICVVGGWNVVTKIGEFKKDDLAIYISIDSFVPDHIAPFLTRPGHPPKEFNGVEGQNLKTKKLRGVISQGLLLPMETLSDGVYEEGQDVSDILGIVKWEPPVKAQLAGDAKGNFPSQFPKTDQERCQNIKKEINKAIENGELFEVTEKLDGSSMTCYLLSDGEFGVCSRNLNLKESEGNSFWKAARDFDIESKMKSTFGEFPERGVAIQGELIGNGVQGNKYNLKGIDFYVYDIVYEGHKYVSPEDRRILVEKLNLNHVPVLSENHLCLPISELLKMAEGKSQLNSNTEREGIVFKSTLPPHRSFKAISNKFLLKFD